MDEKNINEMFKNTGISVGNLLTDEDKSNLRNFAQKVHKMDINDVGRLHNGFADALTSEQKDIVAYEIKLREYDMFKKHGINPKVDFAPENLRKKVEYSNDKVSRKFIMEEQKLNNEMSDELLERSKQIIEDTYIPVNASKFHDKDGGGINALYNKILAIDDNGNKIKVNNRAIEEMYRKNYLKMLSDKTGIDYTRIDEDFYNDFTPMAPIDNPEPTGFQNGNSVVFDKPSTVDQIDMSDYEDDDDEY